MEGRYGVAENPARLLRDKGRCELMGCWRSVGHESKLMGEGMGDGRGHVGTGCVGHQGQFMGFSGV